MFIIGTKGGAPEPEEEGEVCEESWSCTDWSQCANEIQVRTCTDSNNCGTTANKPVVSQACGLEEAVFTPTTVSILTSVIIIVAVIIICVSIFLQRVKITSFLQGLAEKTKKKPKKPKKTKSEKKIKVKAHK